MKARRIGKEAPIRRVARCMAPGPHPWSRTAVLWNDRGEVACGRHLEWLATRRPRRVRG